MEKITFINRQSDNQNRRKILIQSKSEDGNEIVADIIRYDDNVTEAGTVINASKMNKLQDNIEKEFNLIKEELVSWKNIVSTQGTVVNVDNNAKSNINFCSDPQKQIDDLNASINYNAINFAEEEMQKSKNLFDIKNLQYSQTNCEFEIKDNNIVITSSGNGNFIVYIRNLKIGKKYTISVGCITYPESSNGLLISTSNNPCDELADIGLINSTNNSETFEAITTEIYIKGKMDEESVMLIKNLQVEEGETATGYQEYNGKLIHKNEFDFVNKLREHRMILTSSAQSWFKYGLTLLVPHQSAFTITSLADWLFERKIIDKNSALPLSGGSAGAGLSTYPALKIYSSDGTTVTIEQCANNTYSIFNPDIIENYKIYNPFTMEFIK